MDMVARSTSSDLARAGYAHRPLFDLSPKSDTKQIQSLVRPSHSSIVVTPQNPGLLVMSAYDNYSDYTPMEVSTPPGSLQNTPVSTPSRAALLYKPKILHGSPIKFPSLSTPEKVSLKTVDFDADFDDMEPKKNKFKIGRTAWRLLLWVVWISLIASTIYLYIRHYKRNSHCRSVFYIQSAGLAVLRWSSSMKALFTFALVLNSLVTGFSIGIFIMRSAKIPTSPWQTDFDDTFRFVRNWVAFAVCLIGLPAGLIIVPIILGRAGIFNPAHQAWNNACMDPKFNAILQIKYVAVIGNPYFMTIYARSASGSYNYLGGHGISAPINRNVEMWTPPFILYPTVNPANPELVAGQTVFSLPANSSHELIAYMSLNATTNGGQSLQANCTTGTQTLTPCVNGFITSIDQELQGGQPNLGSNPLLRNEANQTKTLEVMYDVTALNVPTVDSTFLRGFAGSWPSANYSFMVGNQAAEVGPGGVLQQYNSNGTLLGDGVQVVNSPWPGCNGLKVCGTNGLNAMIAAGWIWENLEQWMWYDSSQCQP